MQDEMLQELAGLYAADGKDPTEVYEWFNNQIVATSDKAYDRGYEDGEYRGSYE